MSTSDHPRTTVFRNGAVFCANPANSWAGAVAVQDGRIVAVGGDRQVSPYLGRQTELVDLAGGVLLPGFVDAHVHPVLGGLERTRCDLTEAESGEDCLRVISSYAASHPDRAWILGGGWSMAQFPGGCPTAASLDAVVGPRPVYLPNRDHHSAWVNSAALQRAGVDQNTPDPVDGRIERDDQGIPTGTLHEGAMDLVARLLPPETQAELVAGLREAQRYLHSLGVVGWQDAMVLTDGDGPSAHAAYLEAADEGWLTARVSGALWWDRAWAPADITERVRELARTRESTAATPSRYRADAVKVMLDGVAETFTAAMLEPYLDACGHPTSNTGLSFLDGPTAALVTTALDAADFQVHFHALGDRAVRVALDAIEAAEAANGSSDGRHQLAHLQVVHADDIARFPLLSACANIQALWATHEDQMDELTIPFLGDARALRQYPFGELHRAGATLTMGSDWPVSTPDPMAAIHVAVNRVHREADPGTAPLGVHQSLPLGVALAAYTAGSAWGIRREHETGSIVPGLAADLVVLDRNPFDGPPDEIADAQVTRTYIDGRAVYTA